MTLPLIIREPKNILVSGGAGFIGSHFIREMLQSSFFSGKIFNYDSLTYAGNLSNLNDVKTAYPNRYFFIKGDILDKKRLIKIFQKHNIDCLVNFAAETHVDKYIETPDAFIQTNFNGVYSLLEASRIRHENCANFHFHHISTDEVFGSIDNLETTSENFNEKSPYKPNSPYAASKAAADHLVRSYQKTYKLSTTISNCSNNYGSYQFPEKMIPLMISNCIDEKPLPLYGNGANIRDWIHVKDHVAAISHILFCSPQGESYIVGANNEVDNITLVKKIIEIFSKIQNKDPKIYLDKIEFVKDRQGHDLRYAIDSHKIITELGWLPEYSFEDGLEQTIKWYLENEDWLNSVKNGDYRKWIKKQYPKDSSV